MITMANTINFGDLLDKAIERITPYLPNMYEVDDQEYSNDEEYFQFSVYDCGRPEFDENDGVIDYGPENEFIFMRDPDESDEETMDRWNKELQEFCESFHKEEN